MLSSYIRRSKAWKAIRLRLEFELRELGYPARAVARLSAQAETDFWAYSPTAIARVFETKGELCAIHRLNTEAGRIVKGQIVYMF